MNKKQFSNWILSIGGSPHYCGKQKTMFVHNLKIEFLREEITKNNIQTAFKVVV